MTSERVAFESAIAKDPYDQLTRYAFSDWLEEQGLDDEALVQRQWTPEWERSKEYLEDFAKDCSEDYGRDDDYKLTLVDLVVAAKHYLETGRYHCFPYTTPDRTYDDMTEFWEKFKIYTRTDKVPEGDLAEARFFSCSC